MVRTICYLSVFHGHKLQNIDVVGTINLSIEALYIDVYESLLQYSTK